jgi:hypothetical protein
VSSARSTVARGRAGGPGRVRRGGAAVSVDRAAPEPGGMDHHDGSQPGDRPPPPRVVAGGPARRARPAARPRQTGRGGARARRAAAPDLHLLPPRARNRRPRRADAAAAGRPHDGGDHARLPGAGVDHGPAPGPGEGQDPRRADPVPGAERGRPPGPPGGRAGRRLPDLQRGPYGELRRTPRPRGPLRGGHPPRAAPGRADARRAGAPTSPARTRSRRRSTPSTATRRRPPQPTGRRSCGCTTSC